MPPHASAMQHRPNDRQSSFVDELHDSEPRWFAVRTSARHEKKAAYVLTRDGIEAYVPLRDKVSQYPTKTVVRRLPLLNGYVFVRIVRSEELAVLQAGFTRGFVRIGPDRHQVKPEEIEILRLLTTDRQLEWEEVDEGIDFAEGTPVEIIKGPMAGVRGHYLHKKSRKSFVISLMGGGALLAALEIDPALLAPLQGERPSPPEDPGTDERKSLW